MKKLLSLVLASVMLFAVVAGVIPAHAVDAFNVDEVEAKYFDVKPVIDGYISEAEWGTPLVLAEQSNAQTVNGQSPTPNRFFATANGGGYDAATLSMSYILWLSWDENYFYVGAKVSDPDGHSLRNGRGETWDGDALQVRIDPAGANGINGGIEFDPKLDAPSDYRPWSAAQVCDLLFGYCLNAGGYKEGWNNTTGVNKSMTTDSAYTQSMGFVDMAVATAGSSYSSDTANGITTYEIAIPWSYIDFDKPTRQHNYYKFANKKKESGGVITQGPDGAIGYEYGISTAVLNADGASGGNHWNALLTWGSGIVGIQHTEDNYKTCAGSNAVVLSGDKVSEDPAYSAGYATYTVGGPIPTPPQPHYAFEKDASAVKLTYDDIADVDVFGDVSNGERVQLEDGNWVIKWDLATDRDLDEWDPANNPEEPTHNTHNYLSTDGYEPDGADARWEATGAKGPSFTFEFDMMVTDLVTFESGYPSFLANWFGGTSATDYYCGYYFDDSKFKIVNAVDPSEVVAAVPAELTLNEWHHWVFQYDNETCVLRFYFDPAMNGDVVAADAQPIFSLRYKYFDYGSLEKTIAIFRRMNAQIIMDNVQFYNFVDFTHENKIDKEVIDSGNGGGVQPPKEEIFDVNTTIEQLEDGSFALSVANTDAFKAANVKGLSFNVAYDAEKVTFKGVDTIAENAVEITDDEKGNAVIKIKDLAVLKNVDAGATLLRVIVAPKADGLTVDDIKTIVTIKATVTTASYNTGDSVIWVSAAVLVVLALGTGVVVYRRKRSTVEF